MVSFEFGQHVRSLVARSGRPDGRDARRPARPRRSDRTDSTDARDGLTDARTDRRTRGRTDGRADGPTDARHARHVTPAGRVRSGDIDACVRRCVRRACVRRCRVLRGRSVGDPSVERTQTDQSIGRSDRARPSPGRARALAQSRTCYVAQREKMLSTLKCSYRYCNPTCRFYFLMQARHTVVRTDRCVRKYSRAQRTKPCMPVRACRACVAGARAGRSVRAERTRLTDFGLSQVVPMQHARTHTLHSAPSSRPVRPVPTDGS